MGGRRRRGRVEPTEEWEQLALLCRWPEQLAYEEILFGASVGALPKRGSSRWTHWVRAGG